jgi:hypothetical protein
MAVRGKTGGRYRPAQARPATLEELRQYVWQELQQIGGAIDAAGLVVCDDVAGGLVVDGDLLDYKPDILKWCVGRRTRFLPAGYVQGNSYQRGDEVSNGSQISECIVDGATEPPFISPTGDEGNFYNGTLVAGGATAKQVIFGIRVTTALPGYINAVRVDILTGQKYEIYIVRNSTTLPVITEFGTFTAPITGWFDFNATQTAIPAGETFDFMVLVRQPDPTPTVLQYNFDYATPQNNGLPASGVILHSRGTPDIMRVNYIDSDGIDRQGQLQGLLIGDLIRGWGSEWVIQLASPQASYIEFVVSPALNATSTGLALFEFETATPTSITWGSEGNYWPTHQPAGGGVVKGMQGVDVPYSTIVPDDNAYGIDIFFQQAYVPTQWKVKTSGGGGGGGVGGGEANTSSNLGAGVGLAAPKVGVDLPFKSLIGSGLTITSDANTVTLTVPPAPVVRPSVIFTGLTTYNVTASDENALICTTSDIDVAFVLPNGGLPAGFITHVHQYGLGKVTVSAVAPSVCVSSRSLVTRAQHSALSVFNLGNGAYSVVGDQE